MATTSIKQRIGYGIVLLVMVGGTIGGFILMTYQAANPDSTTLAQNQELAALQEKWTKYQQETAVWQEQIAAKYSPIYYDQFKEYQNVNQAYNAESVKELTTKDLKIGDGAEITAESRYQAYYIGWLPDSTVFDSSFSNGTLKSPIEGGNLIEGWNQGVLGMKIGGVRELTIPANLAYGEQGAGSIPANSPIKFVVLAVPPLTDEELASKPVFQQ